MARSFASASSQYLRYASGIGGSAFTFSAWIYRASSGASHVICSRSVSSGSVGTSLILVSSANKLQLYAETAPTQSANISGGTTVNASEWYHVAGVFAAGDYRIYLNGSLENSSAHGNSPAAADEIALSGRVYSGSRGDYFNGRIAEVGLYGVALTVAEIASLAKGYAPLEIRPSSLVAYYPLGGHYGQFDLDRWKNRYDLTPSGSPTWAEHPRVIYPGPSFAPIKATVASTTKYWTFARQAARIIGGGLGK